MWQGIRTLFASFITIFSFGQNIVINPYADRTDAEALQNDSAQLELDGKKSRGEI